MVKMYCMFKGNISKGFENMLSGTENLTKVNVPVEKVHYSYKNFQIVMFSCLLMEVIMVNKYCKCISYIPYGFEKSWVVRKS